MSGTKPAELRSYVLIGVRVQTDSGPLAADRVTTIDLERPRATDVWRAISEAETDIVAVDRTGLRGDWLLQAADLLEDPTVGAVVVTGPDHERGETMFAELGAATVFRVNALREIGGVSMAFPDLSMEADALWRIAAFGYRIVALPAGPAGCYPQLVSLTGRTAVLVSNLERENLERVLPGLVLSWVTQPMYDAGIDTTVLDLQRSPGNDQIGTITLPEKGLTGVREATDLADLLKLLYGNRHNSQATRRYTDRVLAGPVGAYVERTRTQAGIAPEIESALPGGLDEVTSLRTLIVASADPDHLGPLAEPIAALVGALAGRTEVRLLSATQDTAYAYADGTWEAVEGSASADPEWADAIVFEAIHLRAVPWLAATHAPILVDCRHWDVFAEMRREHSGLTMNPDDRGMFTTLFLETIRRADKLVAADEAQRDALLGLLAGMKRLNDLVYDEDASLKSLVENADAHGIADWCVLPRRAIDQVRTFSLELEPRSSLPAPLRQAARAGRKLIRLARGNR